MKNDSNQLSWWQIAKSFWYFLEEDKIRFTVFFFILLGIFFYELVPAYVVGKVVDFFAVYQNGNPLATFYYWILFLVITYLIASFVRLKSKNVLSIIGQHARTRARIWGFERLSEFSLAWHAKENAGNKLQRIFTGSDALTGLSRALRRDVLKIVASIVGVVVIFAFADIRLVVLVAAYTTVFLYIEFAFSKKVLALTNKFNTYNQSAGGTYVESTTNMLSVKALGEETKVVERVANKETISRDIAILATNANNAKWRTLQVVNGISLGIFILLIGQSVISHAITLGTVLVFFTYYYTRLQGSLSDISDLHTDMIDLRSGLSQMMPIFRETEFIKTGNDPFPKDWKKIEMKNGVLDYGGGQSGLQSLNLVVDKNIKVGITGFSGSGKSTLAKVILGLYALKSGEFTIGNKNYYSISHKEVLKYITVVLQETELFNLSLRDNITMMHEEDPALLRKAIEISQLGSVIDKLQEGLESKIGEKGYLLSGGERQRLGIARAVYKNAPIMIFDEATSALDSDTEGKIMSGLFGEYGKGKTFLIIAHRLGTLKYTDKIVVIEKGSVTEEGSYDALMDNQASVFYKMNQEQGSE